MSRFRFSAFTTTALAMALIANPLFAQSSEKSENTITVTGQKLEKKEAKRQSRAFIGQTTVTSFSQYAQRNRPVCPRTIGIDPSYAQIVDTKIRTIATAAKIKIAESNCAPNLFVLFTSDANGLMKTLRKVKPRVFENVNVRERAALYADPVPVRWWHSIELTGSDGDVVDTDSPAPGVELLLSRSYGGASLISKETVINLTGSVVVVDIGMATGYPLDSIAAYVAMVSFSQIKPEKKHETLPSILAIFGEDKNPADAPLDLTPFDYAYVSALYEIPPNRAGSVQKSLIANKMAAKLSQ